MEVGVSILISTPDGSTELIETSVTKDQKVGSEIKYGDGQLLGYPQGPIAAITVEAYESDGNPARDRQITKALEAGVKAAGAPALKAIGGKAFEVASGFAGALVQLAVDRLRQRDVMCNFTFYVDRKGILVPGGWSSSITISGHDGEPDEPSADLTVSAEMTT
jgi:hypothetical protein